MAAESWLLGIERVFEVLPCTDEQKVIFATFTFEGAELVWCIERTTIRDHEGIQAEDYVPSGKVLGPGVKIHRPHRGTLEVKEVACPMKYQLAHNVRRSIEAGVLEEARLVTDVAKRGTKLKTVRRRIEHKELRHQP
ncbi:hypothetical protein Acr_00g0074130 [Actinidia rufa]|uniref:Uncharacterized protein n=1 Tax=Actinidia rufa TaxID=165716 RepID=A0A7J0DUN6_9ERIC|nr:hypothetical protein Acr_00g0074130 [Actinidia rufa]